MTTTRRRRARGVAADVQIPLSRAQEALREQVRSYIAQEPPTQRARAATESGVVFDADLWREFADMEWLGILVPEVNGGAGGTVGDVCVIAEEQGYSLLPSPFLATAVFGGTALCAAGADAELGELAAGRLRIAVALDGRVAVEGATASGRLSSVVDADVADVLLVAAESDEGPALVAVDAAALVVRPERSIDATRHLCTVELDAAPCRVLAAGPAAEASLQETRSIGSIALAAELVGGARRCLESSVEYATNRRQFGQPIGAFQAVKHRCVDVLLGLEAARAAVRLAARLADASHTDAHAAARVAKVSAVQSLRDAAAASVQIHGGSGFLWDTDAHLYLKRAKASERLLGTTPEHHLSLARGLGF